MEKLEPHQDHQHPTDRPSDGAVEEQEVFADIARDYPEWQEHEDCADTERSRQFEDAGWRQLGVPTGQVPDQSQTQYTVAGADTGNQTKDKDAENGGIKGCHF